MADATIPEACTLLNPPITPRDLRAIITALHWPHTGYRHTGHGGHPHPTYPWHQISQLHQALLPFIHIERLLCACAAMPTLRPAAHSHARRKAPRP